ncbi:MAG: transposase [Verrucomicrobiae bacterium]|nr:transposase [Verrucomicrobiae bacterium]
MRAKRRRLEAGFKAKVGLEALKGIKTVAQIAREYQVHPNQVSQWKGEVSQRLPEVFETGPTVQIQEVREIERLERKRWADDGVGLAQKKSRQLGL